MSYSFLTSGLLILLSLVPMTTHAIEEPAYEVTRRIGDIQVRLYGAYAVAGSAGYGSATMADNQAFPILAGHIFGKSKGQKKFQMTAPVTRTRPP